MNRSRFAIAGAVSVLGYLAVRMIQTARENALTRYVNSVAPKVAEEKKHEFRRGATLAEHALTHLQ